MAGRCARGRREGVRAAEEPGGSSGGPVWRVYNRTLRRFIVLTVCTEVHIFDNEAELMLSVLGPEMALWLCRKMSLLLGDVG